jgi:hypothetical protein
MIRIRLGSPLKWASLISANGLNPFLVVRSIAVTRSKKLFKKVLKSFLLKNVTTKRSRFALDPRQRGTETIIELIVNFSGFS